MNNFTAHFSVSRSIVFAFGVVLAACGGSGHESSQPDRSPLADHHASTSSDDEGLGGMGGASEIEPYEGTSLCIISADCPQGAYCDLGQCIQDCNVHEPCEGDATCSDRGRCLGEREKDRDPAPLTEKLGELGASPTATLLSESDKRLRISLYSSSSEPVRYRIVTTAPYLRVAQERGEFTGEGTIELEVDTSNLNGRDVPGTVRIITTLGEVTVNAPIRLGMTGAYEGTMQYFAGDVPLGGAPVTMDLKDDRGGVEVRVHHDQSLLFPSSAGKDTYGTGIFTVSDGLDFTVTHVLEADAAGDRNRFGRPIGRQLSIHLDPSRDGVFEGTFEEQIHGLFMRPVTLHGTLRLRIRPKDIVEDFDSPDKIEMPVLRATTPLNTQLLGQSSRYVVAEAVSDSCVEMAKIPQTTLPDLNAWFSCLQASDEFYFDKFASSLKSERSESQPLSDLREVCETEMDGSYGDFIELGDRRRCMHPLGPAAELYELEGSFSPSSEQAAQLFHRALARMLTGPLFVAQDDIVQGVQESFFLGIGNQKERLQSARARLSQVGNILMQPRLLEFIKRSSLSGAQGDMDGDDTTSVDYPGLRALARYLVVSSVIDGELAALSGSDATSVRDDLLLEAQVNAVLTLFEAAVIAGITDSWGTVPGGVGAELTGSLSPMADGFEMLLRGASVFGVPTGEIPLAFDPKSSQGTNFEQFLHDRAQAAMDQQARDESDFTVSQREFEQNQTRLEEELANLRAGYEATLAEICGSDFDPDSVHDDGDWQQCGATTGTLAEAHAQIEQRHAEALSAQTRLEGMSQKLQIDYQALAQSQGVRDETMQFVDSSNQKINALQQVKNVLSAAIKALELSSNASLMNAGASVAMGALAGVLEIAQGQLEIRRDQLLQAQQMRMLEESKELEFINGMANIKKELVDIHQQEIDIEQTTLAIIQTQLAAQNDLERAKRAHLERRRALARINTSPYSDPTYRMLVSHAALKALGSRREAQKWLYRAGRALEYEINIPFGQALNRAVLAATNQKEVARLQACFETIFNDYEIEAGVPQEFSTTISVREMLGITGPRTDDVTEQQMNEGQLFRQILLQNQNLDGQGGVGIEFSTNLDPGNLLWSSNVCNDKVTAVRAQIVGDFQGDNEAEVDLLMAGGGIMRGCGSDSLTNWQVDNANAAILQAGVNTFGDARANSTLYGQSVARPNWKVIVPGSRAAPANADLDLDTIEDIVLEIKHEALPAINRSINVSLSCLSDIGN